MPPYEFILIAATGRSGSTTLQRILNTIPNSNITGENDNAICNLLKFYKSLKTTASHNSFASSCDILVNKNKKPCWYNSFNLRHMIIEIKRLIIRMLCNHPCNHILGFKEIRYFGCTDLLNVFVELFPNTKIICHYREDTDAQLKSKYLKESDRDYIIKYNQELIEYSNKHKYCYLTTMNDILQEDKVAKLFKFLNKPFNRAKYNQIINTNMH